MKFIAEVEETITVLRKVIIKAENEEEANEIINGAISNSDTVEELHNNLKSNPGIVEIKYHDYKGEEFEVSYLNEYEKYKKEECFLNGIK